MGYDFKFLAVACLGCTLALSSSGADWAPVVAQQPSVPKVLSELNGLRIEVSTEKAIFEIGEDIMVTLILRNTGKAQGNEVSWVASDLSLVRRHRECCGVVEFEVEDDAGKPLIYRGPVGEFIGPGDESLFDWILKNRRLFQSGDFIGLRRPLKELGYIIDKPGRYRLRAVFRDTDYQNWVSRGRVSQAELSRVKEKLRVPLWSGKIESDWVWIELKPSEQVGTGEGKETN